MIYVLIPISHSLVDVYALDDADRLQLEEHGPHGLKGPPGSWRVATDVRGAENALAACVEPWPVYRARCRIDRRPEIVPFFGPIVIVDAVQLDLIRP